MWLAADRIGTVNHFIQITREKSGFHFQLRTSILRIDPIVMANPMPSIWETREILPFVYWRHPIPYPDSTNPCKTRCAVRIACTQETSERNAAQLSHILNLHKFVAKLHFILMRTRFLVQTTRQLHFSDVSFHPLFDMLLQLNYTFTASDNHNNRIIINIKLNKIIESFRFFLYIVKWMHVLYWDEDEDSSANRWKIERKMILSNTHVILAAISGIWVINSVSCWKLFIDINCQNL